MSTVNVRGLAIGLGKPKICVSVMGRNRVEIVNEINMLKLEPFDILEWRVDYFEEIADLIAVKNMLIEINQMLDGKPILFTFRSSLEGGQRWIPADQYSDLLFTAVGSGVVDLVDIELFLGDKFVENLIQQFQRLGVKTVLSNHDFDKTPSKQMMVDRLKNMEYLGADIAKIAVMPCNKRDLLEFYDAVLEAENRMHIPVVAMAMGNIGMISRLSGEIFSSAITFGAGQKASAPGQMQLSDLNSVLNIIHRNMEVM